MLHFFTTWKRQKTKANLIEKEKINFIKKESLAQVFSCKLCELKLGTYI